MKFKRKFIGWLGSAVIATTAISAIASCSFRRHPAGEYEMPSVDFTGNPDMRSSTAGGKTGSLEGFVFSRQLYDGESVTVEVVPEATPDNDISISSHTEHLNEKQDGMSIDFEIDVPEADKYSNKTVSFTLKFIFNYEGKDYVNDSLLQKFSFTYSPLWNPNEVIGDLITYSATYDKVGKVVRFKIENLTLARNLQDGETLVPSVIGSEMVRYETQEITPFPDDKEGAYLSLSFTMPSQDRLFNYSGSFGLHFKFFTSGKSEAEHEQTLSNGKVTFEREYDEIEVILNDPENTSFSATGDTTCYFPAKTLIYKGRNLSTNYNESLTMTLTNNKGEDVSDDLFFDYSYNQSQINDVSITYISEDKYPGVVTYPLLINWQINEDPSKTSDPKQSKGQIPITFTYTSVWVDKNVHYFGDDQEDEKIYLDPVTAGTRQLTVESYNEGESIWADYGLVIDKPLGENETVQMSLENLDESGSEPLELASETPICFPTTDEFGNDCTLVKFTVRYKSSWFNAQESRQYSDYTGADFHLHFKFIVSGSGTEFISPEKNIYVGDTETEQTFNLKYNHLSEPTGDELDLSIGPKYTGKSHGDTIIKVDDGVLNRVFDEDTDILVSDVTSSRDGISIMPGESGSGYENHGVNFNGSSFSMFIKLDYELLVNEETGDGPDTDQEFDVTFTFQFAALTNGVVTNYAVPVDTVVAYSGFSNKITDYIKARTVPIVIYYRYWDEDQEAYFFSPYFLTAFIVGDASPKVDNDYKYYIATSSTSADLYNEKLSQSGDEYFRIGITDQSFASQYKYWRFWFPFVGDVYSDWMSANFYRKNYIYFKNQAITWNDPSDMVFKNATQSDKKNYGCNLRIAEIDFATSFQDYTEHDMNNSDWTAAYMNKLIKLNNYDNWYGHINGIVEEPITNTADMRARYQDFGMSGYIAEQREDWENSDKSVDGTWTMSIWQDYTFTSTSSNSAFTYTPSTTFRSSQSVNYVLDGEKNIYDGSPVYYANSELSCGVHSGYGYYAIEAMNGSMLAVYDKKADEDPRADKVKLVGIFWGWNKDHSDGSNFNPYFDSFIDYDDTKVNLLEPYL